MQLVWHHWSIPGTVACMPTALHVICGATGTSVIVGSLVEVRGDVAAFERH